MHVTISINSIDQADSWHYTVRIRKKIHNIDMECYNKHLWRILYIFKAMRLTTLLLQSWCVMEHSVIKLIYVYAFHLLVAFIATCFYTVLVTYCYFHVSIISLYLAFPLVFFFPDIHDEVVLLFEHKAHASNKKASAWNHLALAV